MDDPIDNNEAAPASLSHVRLMVIMGIVAVLGTVTGFVFFSVQAGVGFGIGGLFSFVNYFWMKRSLKAVFEETPDGERPSFVGGGYLMRYVVFATVMGFIYLVDWHLLIPVILGLSSFAFAVVVEGFIRIFGSFGNRQGI